MTEFKEKIYHLFTYSKKMTASQKKWLFLLGILGFLSGVYFFWAKEQQTTVLETQEAAQREETEADAEKQDGELVYGVQSALRYRPLPNLFADSTSEKKNENTVPASKENRAQATVMPAAAENMGTNKIIPPKEAEPAVPIVRGAVHQGQQHLVMLEYEKKVQPYAAGEYCGSWRIAYINPRAVGIEQGTQVLELSL